MSAKEADTSEDQLMDSDSEGESVDSDNTDGSDVDDDDVVEHSVMNSLPKWCRDPKYNRYWTHYKRMQDWFHQHRIATTSHRRPTAESLDPQYRQFALSNAYNSSYWVYYQYYSMIYWEQRCNALVRRYYSEDFHRRHPPSYHTAERAWRDDLQDSGSMPPPASTFVPRSVYLRSRSPSCSSSSEKASKSKRQKSFTRASVSKRHNASTARPHEGVTDIVLDLDPSVLGQEEEVIECHMEITDEMLEFFAQSAKHRKERDAQKCEEEEREKENKYIDISRANTGAARATTEAPKERPGIKRTNEMKLLYGKGAAMIHGMETAMQLTFDRYVDLNQPKLWPHLPLNIKFD